MIEPDLVLVGLSHVGLRRQLRARSMQTLRVSRMLRGYAEFARFSESSVALAPI